jgi:hypothetical protein
MPALATASWVWFTPAQQQKLVLTCLLQLPETYVRPVLLLSHGQARRCLDRGTLTKPGSASCSMKIVQYIIVNTYSH